MFGLSEEELKVIRNKYSKGSRIVLDYMGEDPHPIEPGTRGTVDHIDDIGTVFVKFDNGRYLGLVSGEDSFHKIHDRDKDER